MKIITANGRRIRREAAAAVMLAVLASSPVDAISQARMSGFSIEGAKKQLRIEAKFKAIPSPEEARKHHRFLTAEPHPAGSERNNELARYIAELWKQQGWEDVTIRRYDVLNTFPREVSCEMIAPVRYKATLREDPYDIDPDTKNPRVQSAYTGLSASGEARIDCRASPIAHEMYTRRPCRQ